MIILADIAVYIALVLVLVLASLLVLSWLGVISFSRAWLLWLALGAVSLSAAMVFSNQPLLVDSRSGFALGGDGEKLLELRGKDLPDRFTEGDSTGLRIQDHVLFVLFAPERVALEQGGQRLSLVPIGIDIINDSFREIDLGPFIDFDAVRVTIESPHGVRVHEDGLLSMGKIAPGERRRQVIPWAIISVFPRGDYRIVLEVPQGGETVRVERTLRLY